MLTKEEKYSEIVKTVSRLPTKEDQRWAWKLLSGLLDDKFPYQTKPISPIKDAKNSYHGIKFPKDISQATLWRRKNRGNEIIKFLIEMTNNKSLDENLRGGVQKILNKHFPMHPLLRLTYKAKTRGPKRKQDRNLIIFHLVKTFLPIFKNNREKTYQCVETLLSNCNHAMSKDNVVKIYKKEHLKFEKIKNYLARK